MTKLEQIARNNLVKISVSEMSCWIPLHWLFGLYAGGSFF